MPSYGSVEGFESAERRRTRAKGETAETGAKSAYESADTVRFEGSERTTAIEEALERL